MYGLNAFALIVFGALSVIAAQMCRSTAAVRERTLRILCAVLLFVNLARYVLSPLLGRGLKVPVEFFTVAYFVVPMILFLRWERLRSWAAYSSLMAGFFYYMAMIAAGGVIYCKYAPYDVYISMFCHGTLYLCGMSIIMTQPCSETDSGKLVLGTGLVVLHALVMRPYAQSSGRLLIYVLIDAACVKQLLPVSSWVYAIPLYYLTVIGLLLLSMRVFFYINRARCGA